MNAVPPAPTQASRAAPLALLCHPATPCAAPLHIAVGVTPQADGLALRFTLQGDLTQVRLPAAMPPGPADGLWHHSCFEAFVATAGAEAYQEFNFAPSGQWAHHRFQRERVLEAAPAPAPAPAAPPRCRWTADQGRLRLDALLPASSLPPAGASLLIGLSAVLEAADGALSYWALQHPAPRPDFHHRGGWALRLHATPLAVIDRAHASTAP